MPCAYDACYADFRRYALLRRKEFAPFSPLIRCQQVIDAWHATLRHALRQRACAPRRLIIDVS